MQNPEPSVDFDTVANEKQQHEVNVGMVLNLKNPPPNLSAIGFTDNVNEVYSTKFCINFSSHIKFIRVRWTQLCGGLLCIQALIYAVCWQFL